MAWGQVREEKIEVDLQAASHPFPHYWEKMFGSGRAILSLRDSYRRDLREVEEVTAGRPRTLYLVNPAIMATVKT